MPDRRGRGRILTDFFNSTSGFIDRINQLVRVPQPQNSRRSASGPSEQPSSNSTAPSHPTSAPDVQVNSPDETPGMAHPVNTANQDLPFKSFNIDDIKDPGEIKQLAVRQLKLLLTRNCIDIRTINEKEELQAKVMQLWIDHNQRKERYERAKDDLLDDDENTCKICMEQEINCVLLECGHYLSCVQCGKKLAECPVCRQNVKRVVRTFRA